MGGDRGPGGLNARPDPVVRMLGISKAFNGVRVLDAVHLDLRPGEVHALVGGNGAGKSTLMKILVGVYTPDEGTYEVAGHEVRFRSMHDAIAARVGMVFQEFSLIPQLTVAQNVFLTREARGARGFIDDRAMVRAARRIFETMKVEIDPGRTLEELPTAYWQLTEIAKALSQDAQVLIMDEPTAALARNETSDLFALMRRLKEQGIAIVYISHRMEEIFEICDRITVLRDGRIAMDADIATVGMADVIRAIIGQQLEHSMDWQPRDVADTVVLEIRGLTAGDRVRDVDLRVRAGEVVGLAGLMGSGRTELTRALFGIDRVDAGEVLVAGTPVRTHDPRAAIRAGIALIPEDRRIQGLVLDHSVRDNIVLPALGRISHAGFVDDGEGDRRASQAVGRLAIVLRSIRQTIRELSGGNQQKVVIAKWLGMEPRILIMDEPTAGVDIGTKAEIVAMIRAFAEAGGSVDHGLVRAAGAARGQRPPAHPPRRPRRVPDRPAHDPDRGGAPPRRAGPDRHMTSGRLTAGMRVVRQRIDWRQYVIYVGFAIVFLFFAITLGDQGFLTQRNLENIVRQTTTITVMAVAMTFVIGAAQIDLSVGSVVGLASVTTAMAIAAFGLPVGIVVGLLTGLIVGVANGLLVAYVSIPRSS